MAIRVLLADDHRIFRESLAHLLAQERGIEVVAQAEDGATAARLAMELSPDVIITDIGMPGLNGIEATRRICEQRPQSRVIALSMHSDAKYITEMLKAGASGYLLKKTEPEKIIEALVDIHNGGSVMTSSVARTVLNLVRGGRMRGTPGEADILTDRERTVLELLMSGRSYQRIGDEMFISVDTVRTHIRRIYEKLQVHTKSAAVAEAMRRGLV